MQGELRYISTSGQPAFDGAGRFLGYRGISKDITRQIQIDRRIAVEQAVNRILAEANTVNDATQRILRAVCEPLGWTCGAYWALDQEAQTLTCVETWGVSAPGVDDFRAVTKKKQLPVGNQGLVRRTCASGEPQWIRNVTKEKSFQRGPEALAAKLRSAFAFPIKVNTT